MKLLVTGGAGYVGCVLVPHLLAQGHQVRVLDNLMYGGRGLLACFSDRRFEFVKGTILDERRLRQSLDGVDAIIHLAGIVGYPACQRDPRLAQEVNLDGTRLVDQLRKRDQPIIFASTGSNYGAVVGALCTEDTPLNPLTEYGTTKTAAERHLLEAGNTVCYRFATAFGVSPRMRFDLLVNDFVYKAVTDRYLVLFEKDFKRNFVHVRDVADCMRHAIANAARMAGRPYNLGLDSANLTKEELALTVKKHVPSFYIHFAPIGQDPDRRNYIVSSQRLREAGFEARRSLDEGIQELLKGYRMQGRAPFQNAA